MSENRAVRRTVAAATAGLLATVAALTLVRDASYDTAIDLVLETAVTLVGGLVALLLYGRYRNHATLGELLLVYAVSVMALSRLVFAVLPEVYGEPGARSTQSWSRLSFALVAAALMLLAAVVPTDRNYRRQRAAGVIAIHALVLVGMLAVMLVWPDRGDTDPRDPLAVALKTAAMICSAAAAAVFTLRAERSDDQLLGWIGAATALGAWGYLSYLLQPWIGPEASRAGDLLRIAMYLLLLVGAVVEIGRYWESKTATAVELERRRLARDLHDGVVQELGYIRQEALRYGDADAASRISAAADRALDEARRSISALVQHPDEGLAAAVARASYEVGDRYDVPVSLSLDDSVTVPADVREALVRIAREAVANAARHARTPSIAVSLAPGCLEVADTGCGFDPAVGRSAGFGLTSMRERADAIDATVRFHSEVGRGTRVRVTW